MNVAVRSIGLFLLALTVAACSEPPYTNLDNEQLEALMAQGVPVYDIRRAPEWRQTGVVENSRLMTFVDASGRVLPDFLARFTGQTHKDQPVILICRTGSRTATLARYLAEQLGYTQVYNVRSGIRQWIRDGRPVSRIGRSETGTARQAAGAL
jgi:rhodanese-related sulfurtransferase